MARINRITLLRAALLLAAVAFIAIGAARSEMLEVFRKAATLCLQCIGIG